MRFRTYTTDNVVGVEMAGAIKNVYASPSPCRSREVDAIINHGSAVEQAYRGVWAEKPGTSSTARGSGSLLRRRCVDRWVDGLWPRQATYGG